MTEPLAQPGSNPDANKGNLDPAKAELLKNQNFLAMQENESFSALLRKTRHFDAIDKVGASPENVERAERLVEGRYERLMFSTLEHHLVVSNECLEFRNPYATWISKPGRDLLDGMLSALRDEYFRMDQKKLVGKEVSPRREAWLKRMYADFSWLRGSYAQQEGVGHLMKYYFSGPDMMLNALYEQRINPLADHFRKTYAKEVPELEMTQQEKEISHRLLKGKEGGQQGEVEYGDGIRERAVKMQKDRFHHVVGAAQVFQIDWDDVDYTNGQPNWEAYIKKHKILKNITPNEIEAYLQIFGTGGEIEVGAGTTTHKVPRESLSWFVVEETHIDKAKYKSRMEALLVDNVREKLAKAKSKGEIDTIVTDVIKKANELQNKELGLNLEEKLARTIVKGGVVTDLARGYSLKLGWNYKYDSAGKRSVNFSGIYNGMDTYTVGWPFHHNMVYDIRASKRAGLPPPTNAYYRNYVNQFPPTEWPDLLWGPNGAAERDPRLKKAMGYLFGTSEEGRAWQEEHNLIPNPEHLAIVKELMWGWGTGWDSDQVKGFNYAGLTPKPGEDEKSVESRQTFFALAIPPEIGILLFENTVKLEGHKDANGLDKTMWEELTVEGVELDALEYDRMKPDAFDRWHVDMNMLGRVVSTLVDPLKEDFRKQFFDGPGQLKELLKRLYLGLRDEVIKVNVNGKEVQVPGPVLWCCYASTLIAWYYSSKTNLISKEYADNGKPKAAFANEYTGWIEMDMWMPGDIPGAEKFSSLLTTMTFFGGYQMNYIGADPKGGGDDKTMYTKAERVMDPIKK